MNPMWNEAVLQRLRVAAGNRNPAEARLAVRQHYLGFFPRWRGDAVLTCWMVPLGLLFLCLGLVAPPEFPLSISTGFTAQNSYFAACAFALMLAQVCRETWHVPEILAMAPISPEALGRIAHRHLRRKLLMGFAGSIMAVAAVFVIYATAAARRGVTFHPAWAFPAAAAFWLHLIATAGALPRLRRFGLRRKTGKKGTQAQIKIALISGVSVFFGLSFIALFLAPLALGGQMGPAAAELGRVCNQILAPSGLLLWPTQPSAVPWWQLILTALLLIAALPSFSWVWASFRIPPVVTPEIDDYWQASCPDDWEDEEDPLSVEPPGAVKAPPGTSWSGDFAVPSPAASLSEKGHRDLTGQVRLAMDDPDRKSPFLFLPQTGGWRERWPKLRWGWLVLLLPLFAGTAWGNSIGLLLGWVWLTVQAATIPHMEAPVCRALFHYYDEPALHRRLPISLEPTWRTLARHDRNTMKAYFIAAGLFPLAGWLISHLADLPGSLWPWQRYGFQGVEFLQTAATASIVIATIGVMQRAIGPANFGDQLNKRQELCGGWQFFCRIPWLVTCLSLAATAAGSLILVALVFGYAPIRDLSLLLPLLLAAAGFAAGEGLRQFSLRLVFWQWARARKR